MGRRVPRRGNLPAARNGNTGQPSKLTDRTRDAIVHAVLEGNHLTAAAAAAGVSRATLYRWIDLANDVEEAIEAGKPYDDGALPYLDFRDRLADARAQAEMRAVKVIHRAMQGGYVKSEKPLQDAEGHVMYNANNGDLIVERTYAEPDGRLALSYLARSRPDQWGQSATNRVELTGSGGGPVQHEVSVHEDQISKLAGRLAEVVAMQREDRDPDGPDEEYVVESWETPPDQMEDD